MQYFCNKSPLFWHGMTWGKPHFSPMKMRRIQSRTLNVTEIRRILFYKSLFSKQIRWKKDHKRPRSVEWKYAQFALVVEKCGKPLWIQGFWGKYRWITVWKMWICVWKLNCIFTRGMQGMRGIQNAEFNILRKLWNDACSFTHSMIYCTQAKIGRIVGGA